VTGAPPSVLQLHAARYRRPTVVFERLLGRGAFFSYLPTLDDVIASRGGNPLIVGGKVIGAIGASGGSGSQDDVISQADYYSLAGIFKSTKTMENFSVVARWQDDRNAHCGF